MNIKKGIYGGVFDVITNGHLHIIQKACTMFDNVIVVIAENANKKTMFTLEERWNMVCEVTKDIDNVQVKILPKDMYLVKFAEQLEADFLIRGIRDTIDFPYELNIYRTNRKISQLVETVYLMPDDNFSLVSSSWIKGLMGIQGWKELIKNDVHPYVLKKLEIKLEEKG